ncbi:5536_t:CDS:2, partial [Cetraspora pellucida]
DQARADWIICQYGRAHALHAIRLGPSFINLPVTKAIVAKKAILSRYFVQKLLINFGKPDQQLLKLKIAYNMIGQADISRMKHKGALLILFPPMLSPEQKKQNVRYIKKRLTKLLNLGFQLNYNAITDALHLFEHRLNVKTLNILCKNLDPIRDLTLNKKFIPFPPIPKRKKIDSYHEQFNSEECAPNDGFESNRQLNITERAILIHKDLVNLWKQIGYYEICNEVNNLVMQGALLILFPPTPSTEWKKPSVQDVNNTLNELLNLGFQLNYNVIADALHLFEDRLDNIGNILMGSFLHVKQEVPDTFLYHCLIETLRPERTYKVNVWDFIYSFIPDKAECEFNRAFNNLSNASIIISDIHIKPLASSTKFYKWVLRKFGTNSLITALCFNDLLETRASLDIQLQKSNVDVSIGMSQCMFKEIRETFEIYCYTKKNFLPSHLKMIQQNDILGQLFDKEITFPLHLETTKSSNNDQNGFQNVFQNQILSTERAI